MHHRTGVLRSSYSKPPGGLRPWRSERRPLLPIQPQPTLATDVILPELPSPSRCSLIDEWYTLSTHIVPAAFPRSTPDVEHPPGDVISAAETKSEKLRRIAKLRDAYYDLKVRHWDGRLVGHSEKKMWNCVNRYVLRRGGAASESGGGRAKKQKKLTLFLAHANGFMKEIWEPSLKHLVSMAAKRGEPLFDEIWAWEAANHGDSALINESSLCAIYDWSDNTRDILNFMLNYIPDSVENDLPVHLPRIPSYIAKSREKTGFTDRVLVSVGHSFGGNTTTLAAINFPALFSSLMLIDPIIYLPPLDVPWVTQATLEPSVTTLVDGALQRRTNWPSREEAMRLFQKNPFFAAWDPTTLEIYVECALHSDPKGGVRLKMSGVLEAVAFTERRTSFDVWDLLPELDDKVESRFVMPGNVLPKLARERQELVWIRPRNTSHVRLMSIGHLIPHEVPEELAREIYEFVEGKYGTIKANL